MTGSTLDAELKILLDEEDLSDDGLLHGVHMECQSDRDRPLTACGIEVDWLGGFREAGKVKCPTCWSPDGSVCPSCGGRLLTH